VVRHVEAPHLERLPFFLEIGSERAWRDGISNYDVLPGSASADCHRVNKEPRFLNGKRSVSDCLPGGLGTIRKPGPVIYIAGVGRMTLAKSADPKEEIGKKVTNCH